MRHDAVRCPAMSRLLRILLNVITALSLLLCAASAMAWVRSYRSAVDTVIVYRVSRDPGALTSSEYALLWCRGTLRYSIRSTIDTCDHTDLLDELESFRRSTTRGYKFVLNPVDWFERNTFLPRQQTLGPVAVGRSFDVNPFQKEWQTNPGGHRQTWATEQFDVRLWLVVTVFATIPSVRTVRFVHRALRQRGRGRAGLCPTCGYDCRATPDRCPECGAVPNAQPARPGGAGG
jgi:hypothetical protein